MYQSKSSIISEGHSIDRLVNALISRTTLGLSPTALALACLDWYVHLARYPGKQSELWQTSIEDTSRLLLYFIESLFDQETPKPFKPEAGDYRFSSLLWNQWPYSFCFQNFLLYQKALDRMTTRIEGVEKQHEDIVNFIYRQVLDMFCPANYPLTNPDVTHQTMAQGGLNIVQGLQNWCEDLVRLVQKEPPVGSENYEVGKNIAVTKGKVVFQNRLIELIQYEPTTKKVYAEPLLIVPAWIMKYYILDLSPENSMVKHLVDEGFTVFMISWKNPTEADKDLGMSEYQKMGVMDAINAIGKIIPNEKIHTCGYCLGGTILSITAATMAREKDNRLASMTMLAAQTDFKEAGELMLFINQSQLTFLQDMMWSRGYLDTKQMAGAFTLLRSNDLLWSSIINNYMLGDRRPMNDLMAWNADATRMPYRMHSEYLTSLFLNNDFSEGRYMVKGKPIAFHDIRTPVFAVGTVKDHVAPWKSVFKVHLLSDVDEVTFLLTSGGHNAGIVSQPGKSNRSFQVRTISDKENYVDPETWIKTTPKQEGSWWPTWFKWMKDHSTGKEVVPPHIGSEVAGLKPLREAPGEYVRAR